VKVGPGAVTGAGSVIPKGHDVPPREVVVGVPAHSFGKAPAKFGAEDQPTDGDQAPAKGRQASPRQDHRPPAKPQRNHRRPVRVAAKPSSRRAAKKASPKRARVAVASSSRRLAVAGRKRVSRGR
jgi:carbonic anhydrase/acetyltransferase-like protein (isoleucine patch superfamily)